MTATATMACVSDVLMSTVHGLGCSRSEEGATPTRKAGASGVASSSTVNVTVQYLDTHGVTWARSRPIPHTRWRSERRGAPIVKILTVVMAGAGAVPEAVDCFLALVGERSRERFAARDRSVTVVQSLIAEVAIRWLLARSLGCIFEETELERDSNGKPRFSSSDMTLSLAHSGDMVAVAIAEQAVGIDVQRVRHVRPGLAERFFHPSEIARIQATNPTTRDELLIGMWARKESFAKFDGRGLRRTIGRFRIGDGTGPFLPVIDVHGAPIGVVTLLHSTTPGFALASCAISGTTHPVPESMTASALFAEASRLRGLSK